MGRYRWAALTPWLVPFGTMRMFSILDEKDDIRVGRSTTSTRRVAGYWAPAGVGRRPRRLGQYAPTTLLGRRVAERLLRDADVRGEGVEEAEPAGA